MEERLEEGLIAALEDWNESRETEGAALARDMTSRIAQMEEWVSRIDERAPEIKEERFAVLRERLSEALAAVNGELEEGRFLQEMVVLSDKLDVSEELTRLHAHLERLRDLLEIGTDAGRRLDFTLQECFREIATCGNKIQDAQTSRLVVDFKNELEKCREQVPSQAWVILRIISYPCDERNEKSCKALQLFVVCRRLLLALEVRIVGYDHVFVDAQRHIAVDLDQQGGLLDLLHDAVDAAGGDDFVAFFQTVAELLHLFAALGLGTPHEQPENQHHEADHNNETVLLHESRLRLYGDRLKKINHNCIRFKCLFH